MKEYNYINDFGISKKLVVGEIKDGKYPITLWENEHGEFCGSGTFTPKQLIDYLAHYGITA